VIVDSLEHPKRQSLNPDVERVEIIDIISQIGGRHNRRGFFQS
jgi:hypothetical protein